METKIGRPSKGDRRMIRARVPVPMIEAIQEQAARRGMTINDFIGEQLEKATGVPYSHQGSLPMTA